MIGGVKMGRLLYYVDILNDTVNGFFCIVGAAKELKVVDCV